MITKRMLYFILIILGISLTAETNAQSRLYPPGKDHSKGTLSRYDARVDSLLLNDRRFDSFAFTILPSFSGEQGCYYVKENYELVLKAAKKSIWYKKTAEVEEYRCPCPHSTASLLKELFEAAVFSSSYLATPYGLDGVTYEILINGGYYTARCWSPKKDTNCHKLVEILEELTSAVKGGDQDAIEILAPKIKELTEAFKSLYPEDVK